MDLKPFIYQLSVSGTEKDATVHMLVNASSSGNIKPALVMETFLKANEKELSEFALEITREETFTDAEKDGKRCFIPLDAVGTEF